MRRHLPHIRADVVSKETVMNWNRKTIEQLCAVICIAVITAQAMTPNPIISRGKPTYGSAPGTSVLVDGKFNSAVWPVANGSWVAIKVGAGPSRIFFNWNNPAYSWSNDIGMATSCKSNMAVPRDYTILTSFNSTNGINGQWTAVDSVRGNTVTARGHIINFAGANWVKMSVQAGGGTLDEIEVFDVSKGARDIWFFPGTSITANTYKESFAPAQNFADIIAAEHPGFHPAMIRGGIGCINSTTFAADISKYLAVTRNVAFWAIEMGTNDAWGGNDSGVGTFVKNMQLVIDSCKAAGIQPIIARIIATDSAKAGWEVNPVYLKAIDSLTGANSLIAGPDLYTWFRAHPEGLNKDGVHPDGPGGAAIQRLWAEKMSGLYTEATLRAAPAETIKK